MFDHPKIEKYEINDIPLNADIYLMDEGWIPKYESALLRNIGGTGYESVGYVSFAAARSINTHDISLTWFANIFNKWHEIEITIPKEQIVICVGCSDFDEKPRIFVKSGWINHLYLKQYSIYCLIDAAYVKKAISECRFDRSNLITIRNKIDALAANHPDISFISFADSILLKSNWTVGTFDSEVKYTYNPHFFISLANTINSIYIESVGLKTYAIITQGANEFHSDSVLHISDSQNHISLNSLGGPFAKLTEIDYAIKVTNKDLHSKFDFYLDAQYYHSLSFNPEVDKHTLPHFPYASKFPPSPGSYFCMMRDEIKSAIAT